VLNRCVPRVVWGRILSGGHDLGPTSLTLLAGRIAKVDPAEAPLPGTDLVVDDGWIIPGLIDLQVNGAGGVDFTSAKDPEQAVEKVGCLLAQHGVTAFCPTIVSAPAEVIVSRLRAWRAAPAEQALASEVIGSGVGALRSPEAGARKASEPAVGRAVSLGAHVEGPFIDPEHRGVHDLRMLREATAEEIGAWIEAGPPALVTLAPELSGAEPAIEQLTAAGVVVSLGHSGADAAAAQAGLGAGARMGTHLFNAMPALHHRRPGLVGALMSCERATLGLIADGDHVDPLVVELVVRAAGPARVALVSDALAAAGAPPGKVSLGEQTVYSDGQVVRRADGTLAGSAVLLDTGLRNARAWLPWLSAAQVVQMSTQTPADLLGLPHKGRIAIGADADLVVLDNDWHVVKTIIGGR
jgi:N-acetylglucosamine-6-phosphate deacetylase